MESNASRLSSKFGSDSSDSEREEEVPRRVPSSKPKEKGEEEDIGKSLLFLQKDFAELKGIMKKNKLNADQLQVAMNWGMERLFDKNCPELMSKGKRFFNNCSELFDRLGDKQISGLKQKANKGVIGQSKVVQEFEKVQESQSRVQREQSADLEKMLADMGLPSTQQTHAQSEVRAQNKVEKKSPPQTLYERPTEVKTDTSYTPYSSYYSAKGNNSGNPYVLKSPDAVHQQHMAVGPETNKSQAQDLTLPIMWENKADFLVQGRKVRKLHSNDYRKMCSLDPLKEKTIYKLKFRVLHQGTIALGLVPKANKGGLFIDDRYTDALKFITFCNGDGGKLKLNGEELHSGKSRGMGMKIGDEFEMVFDSKAMTVTIKTTKMREAAFVDLSVYKDEELYVFLEMKQMNTCIEFLSK